jgi:glycosyltransferase involved in cell wall biosynthesis
MKKILVLCPYPERRAPSQRLKFEQYYDSWRAAGYQLEVRPFWDEAAWEILYERGHYLGKLLGLLRGLRGRALALSAAREAALVYLHLEAAPIGPPLIERLIAASDAPIVYDVEDLLYLPYSSASNRFMRWLRGRDKVFRLMRLSRHVVVCSEHLRRLALAHNPRVTNIAPCIDTARYQPRPHRPRTEGVVIGWTGSHSTSPYLHLLDEVLRELQRTDAIRVRVIGDAAFQVEGLALDARPWVLETEIQDLSEVDIGVYPLPEEEWVLGKSGLKALQYMGLAIPTVAQRIGPNLEIIAPDANGLLASGPGEWRAALRDLIRHPELRRRLGEAGRQTVLERYSVEGNRRRYLDILDEVAR